MKKRYRYVLTGGVTLNDTVSDFRLIAATNLKPSYWGDSAVRIEVDEIELTKWQSDSYSTTRSNKTLRELNGMHIMYFGDKKKWMKVEPEQIEALVEEQLNKHRLYVHDHHEQQKQKVVDNPEKFWGKTGIVKSMCMMMGDVTIDKEEYFFRNQNEEQELEEGDSVSVVKQDSYARGILIVTLEKKADRSW